MTNCATERHPGRKDTDALIGTDRELSFAIERVPLRRYHGGLMADSRPSINQLLSRGGLLTAQEIAGLCAELTEDQLHAMQHGTLADDIDQPVKVIPREGLPKFSISGYFTQEKFLLNNTPRDLELVLGIKSKLRSGAYVLAPTAPILPGAYSNKAYSHLPDGKPFNNPDEKVFIPGKGAPQWQLTTEIPARVLAELEPDEAYRRIVPPLKAMTIRVAELDKNVNTLG
jgi:hypothetical protein